jgi:hypothetical protein
MSWFRRRRRPENSGAAPGATAPADPAPSVGPVNNSEQRWINDQLQRLRISGVDLADPVQLGAYYDRLLTHWVSTSDNGRPDPNPDINLIGIGLGEHLRHRAGLQWAVVTDAEGAEIALYGQPGDILIYPTSAVAKRWVAHQAGFLPDFADEVVRSVEEIRSDSV